ncbi:flagellar hook-basal body complex protein FliE [bacterium]|nr:flagellar hook-basal body complex protein FliE [bacterium]
MANLIQNSISSLQPAKTVNPATPRSAAKSIATSFEKMFDEVNNDQMVAEKKVAETIIDKKKDIAGAMIAMEKADVSLRMLMAVRNKIVNAYQEMMRMQV